MSAVAASTEHSDRPTRWRWWIIGVAVVAVIGGGVLGGYLWLTSDQAVPVDVQQVAANFRTTTTVARSPTTPAPTSAAAGSTTSVASTTTRPAAPIGVYVYNTTGQEGVDALGGSEHPYPAATTITMSDLGNGCRSTRWDALEQRWSDAQLCPGPDGWTLSAKTVYHAFFHQSDERVYSCQPGSVHLPADLTPDLTFSAYCTSGGTSASGASTEEIHGRVIGDEAITVDGQPVDTVHVQYQITIGGETGGQTNIDRWYARDVPLLLVKEVSDSATTSEEVIGTVHYDERYELVLQSLEPIA